MVSLEDIISLCKRRGFITAGSEIYGGLGGTWDFGPLGALMKINFRQAWVKRFIQERDDVDLIEGAILMNKRVWQASGHEENFHDFLVECKECHERFRADHLAEGQYIGQKKAREAGQCPNCGSKDFTPPREFNLMFETYVGPIKSEEKKTYLRPETAQSMFTNFKYVYETQRRKLPFGIGQYGKAFRNEITTGNFIFRSREFEIAEIEYFVKPGEDEHFFELWLKEWERFFLDLGIEKSLLRLYEHPKEKLAHYSKRTVDFEFSFAFGWGEIGGVANRTDFDLKQHQKFSGEELAIFDEKTKQKIIPFVIEPTMGVERVLIACLCNAYEEIKGGRTETTQSTKEVEVVLHLSKVLAPIKIAVFPLVKKEALTNLASDIVKDLKKSWFVFYDDSGSIGRRYRRQDEIGTPYCVTIDFQSLEDGKVTVRDRDTMKQERIAIQELKDFFRDKFIF